MATLNDSEPPNTGALSDEEWDDYLGGEDDCFECGGEGWITAECFEDTCCCADPEVSHGIIPCPLCNRRAQAEGE